MAHVRHCGRGVTPPLRAPEPASPDVAELIARLQRTCLPDPEIASDLEAVQASQGDPPRDPWAS